MIFYRVLMFAVAEIPQGLSILASVLGIGIAVIFHEVSHGYVANLLGDSTAKYAGRLSLNPIRHVDLWGTIIIPLFLYYFGGGVMFGWAKPVPVNYYNLRYSKWGPVIVALAGPATNFLIVLIFGILTRFVPSTSALPYLLGTITWINASLMLFNLLPIPPLDGSKVLFIFLENRPDIVNFIEKNGFFLIIFILIFVPSLLTRLVAIPALTLTSSLTGLSPAYFLGF